MRKTICNTKLNKILSSFLIVIILFGYISPIKVNAENESSCSLSEYIKKISGKSDLEKALKAVQKDKNKKNSIIEALKKHDNRYKNIDSEKIEEMIFYYLDDHHFYGEGTTITYSVKDDSYEIKDVSTDAQKVIIEDLYFWLYYCQWEKEKYTLATPTYKNCEAFMNGVYSKYKGNYITTGVDENGEIYIEIYVKNSNDISANIATFLEITDVEADVICQNYNGDTEYGLFIKLLDSSEFTEEREEELEGATTQEEKELIILRHYLEDLDLDGNPETQDRLDTATIEGMINLYKSGGDEIKVTWNEERTEVIAVDFKSSYFGKDVLGETLYNKEVKEEVGEGADIGGILMSPLIYLINFVADAITSNLGNIMMGDNISLFSGIGVLTETKPVYSTKFKTEEHYVNIRSFAPNFLDFDFELNDFQYPNIKYTPEEIFSGQVPLLSVDFISGTSPKLDQNGNAILDENGNIIYEKNSDLDWQNIRSVISSWYKVLRMVAIIGFLSVLIYTGIKIIISANAGDKAKYKEWIINWFMGVAILFIMHYMMSFIMYVSNKVNQILGQSCQGIEVVLYKEKDQDGNPILLEGEKYRFKTNLMGLVRFMVQSENTYIKIGYEVMYVALIVYTCKFTMVYLKRVLKMAFLTLIAPIVALTYPIDKLSDGKAQGFDMWLKEYIYNVLLQPMHYIMYFILVSSAISVSASNPIYGIVVLSFMAEAEKLLKKIFGFDKANGGTVEGLGGAFAAGAIASNIKNIARMSKLGSGSGGKDASGALDNDSPINNPKPDTSHQKLEDDRVIEEMAGIDSPPDDKPDDKPDDLPVAPPAASPTDTPTAPPADTPVDTPSNTPADTLVPPQPATSQPTLSQTVPSQPTPSQTVPSQPDTQQQDSTQKEKNKLSPQLKGLRNVRNRIMKPLWDYEVKDRKYNGKRLAKQLGRGALGVGLGIGAAAVQAGISLTDGKYNPMEGIATFAAGYAGAGQISKATGKIIDTYRDGRDEGNQKAIMKRAQEKWSQREDVIKYNKKYNEEDRETVLDIQKQLLEQGIRDPKEMDRVIKFMKTMNGDKINGASKDIVRLARIGHDFYQEMRDKGVKIYEEKSREAYINTVAGNNPALAKKLRNQFDLAIQYDKAQKG